MKTIKEVETIREDVFRVKGRTLKITDLGNLKPKGKRFLGMPNEAIRWVIVILTDVKEETLSFHKREIGKINNFQILKNG